MKLQTKYYNDILSIFQTHVIATKSLRSGDQYTGQIKRFLIFLEQNEVLNLNDINSDVTNKYFHHLSSRQKNRGEGKIAISTINGNLSILRAFSTRMQKEKLLKKSFTIPKNTKIERDETENDNTNPFGLVRQILNTEEIKLVFETCHGWEEKALIALAYGAGLRRGSLENLLESHINFKDGMVTAFLDKNNKTRRVPISEFFLKVLKEYSLERLKILARLNKRESLFFIDQNGKHINGEKLNEMLKTIVKRTLNNEIIDKNLTLHCLRHSTAVHLMDAGESFEYIREYLGHSIADTSLIYAKRRKIKKYYQI